MTDIVLPKTNQTGTNEWADVEDNDNAIVAVVNGNLDNGNLSASAAIVDTKLASPSNAAWRTLYEAGGWSRGSQAAATYFLIANGGISAVTAAGAGMHYFDPADFAVAGKTTQIRVRGTALINNTAPGVTYTFGLYPVTSGQGGLDVILPNLGTVITGSTAAIAAPAANGGYTAASSAISAPAVGHYLLAVALSGGTTAASSAALLSATLQMRYA